MNLTGGHNIEWNKLDPERPKFTKQNIGMKCLCVVDIAANIVL